MVVEKVGEVKNVGEVEEVKMVGEVNEIGRSGCGGQREYN